MNVEVLKRVLCYTSLHRRNEEAFKVLPRDIKHLQKLAEIVVGSYFIEENDAWSCDCFVFLINIVRLITKIGRLGSTVVSSSDYFE